jgi:hypothetical protein
LQRIEYYTTGGSALVSVENVWAALPDHGWVSCEALRESSGLDKETLSRIIGFLVKYDFIEAQDSAGLYVKRKTGRTSPMVVINLLQSLSSSPTTQEPSKRAEIVAERVACARCGSKCLKPRSENELECQSCHQRQWRFIRLSKSRTISSLPFLRKFVSGLKHCSESNN